MSSNEQSPCGHIVTDDQPLTMDRVMASVRVTADLEQWSPETVSRLFEIGMFAAQILDAGLVTKRGGTFPALKRKSDA